MSSPWKALETVKTDSIQEIMSEEFARGLQDKENKLFEASVMNEPGPSSKERHKPDPDDLASGPEEGIPEDVLRALQEGSGAETELFDNDAMIAQMLQTQFDLEHDEQLKTVERHRNKNAKVKISYRNYQCVPDNWLDQKQKEREEEEEDSKPADWDRFETVEKEFNQIPKCGYMYDEEGDILTKHDERINGIRNAARVMSFPPEFPTGDGAGFDMKLNNKVFNQLRNYSKRTKKSKMHDRKENVATAEFGLDEPTRLLLYKLINNQVLEQVNGIVSTGKEAVILHADCDENYEGELTLPREVAIKIFKTTLNEFKQRDRYIKDDYRFKDRFSKQNNRTVIAMWAEKEMHNLSRMRKVGILCPEVVMLKNQMLIMSFIGKDNVPAPKLKDVPLNAAQLIVAYDEVIAMMKTLYTDANLVHADLSEYNILYMDEKCYFIDVAQSIEPSHPSAFEYLLRDCGNVVNFFDRRGVKNVKTKEELFTEITGLDPVVHHTTMLERLHNKGVPEHVATVTDVDELPEMFKPLPYPFDYAFEKMEEEAKRRSAAAKAAADKELPSSDDEEVDNQDEDDNEEEQNGNTVAGAPQPLDNNLPDLKCISIKE